MSEHNEADLNLPEIPAGVNITPYQVKAFFKRVQKTDHCWIWTGTMRGKYGAVYITKKDRISAHRFSYMLHKGAIPNGKCACHSCDNTRCVNPDHLWLGSNADNTQDSVNKNRRAKGVANGAYTHPEKLQCGDGHWTRKRPKLLKRGEQHGKSKLTEKDVVRMRELWATDCYTITTLAKTFKVPWPTVRNVVFRRTWRHII